MTPDLLGDSFLDVSGNDNALIHFPFTTWLTTSAFTTRARCRSTIHATTNLTITELVAAADSGKVMRELRLAQVASRVRERLLGTIMRRTATQVSKWMARAAQVYDPERHPIFPSLIASNLRRLGAISAPPLHVAAVRTVFNAWPFHSRFGHAAVACPLCGLAGGSSMEHAMDCSVMRTMIPNSRHNDYLNNWPLRVLAFLYADLMPGNTAIATALWHSVFGHIVYLSERGITTVANAASVAYLRLTLLTSGLASQHLVGLSFVAV